MMAKEKEQKTLLEEKERIAQQQKKQEQETISNATNSEADSTVPVIQAKKALDSLIYLKMNAIEWPLIRKVELWQVCG